VSEALNRCIAFNYLGRFAASAAGNLIGRAITDLNAYVLDGGLESVPAGAVARES
jgi:hypothetical protein